MLESTPGLPRNILDSVGGRGLSIPVNTNFGLTDIIQNYHENEQYGLSGLRIVGSIHNSHVRNAATQTATLGN